MKAIARSLVVVLVALFAVPALVVSVTITSAIQLLATTALIMGGTQHSLGSDDDQSYIPGYLNWAVNDFIVPGTNPHPDPDAADFNTVAVIYPAQFAPVTGTTTFDDSVSYGVGNLGSCLGVATGSCTHNESFDDPATPGLNEHFIVYGYSQSAVVASLIKNQLIDSTAPPTNLAGTQFFLISNPMRPNGGILARDFEGLTIPLIGITFYGPTENSCPEPCDPGDIVYPTVDVAQQYDFLGGDAPVRPLNFLAMANSIAAYAQLHGAVQNHELGEDGMIDQGQYGDTHYYMISANTLPILQPLVTAGVPAPALAIPDAILRVWIEDAYDRNSSPGEHVTFQWSPIGDPIGLIGNTLGAIPVGIDDTVEGFTTPGNRPLNTQHAGPFGVGGPEANTVETLDAAGAGSAQLAADKESPAPPKDSKQVENKGNVIDNPTPEGTETPAAAKPEPFAKLRESLKFDPDSRPLGIRPSGDRPLKRIVDALTGQRPKAAETQASDDAPAPAEDAA